MQVGGLGAGQAQRTDRMSVKSCSRVEILDDVLDGGLGLRDLAVELEGGQGGGGVGDTGRGRQEPGGGVVDEDAVQADCGRPG